MPSNFIHLHNHTEFSLLDGAGKIEDLISKACNCGMHAVGISDHGNLFGVPKFVLAARKQGLKPIIGSEFYLCDDHLGRTSRGRTPEGEKGLFHQILFAKNEVGYHNLCKLSSISYTEGYYYKARIDKQLLARYHEGLIATSCCLASEINQAILMGRLEQAEAIFRWYVELFAEDYYVEVQRHGLKDQERCNQVLLGWAAHYGVRVIATNDVHYVNKEDSEAHDLLLALQTASDYAEPGRFRFKDDAGELNPNYFFKTPEEMQVLFADLPQALENTLEIADKCNFELKLTGDLILPTYQVPEEFAGDMDAYLAALTWQGARHRYGEALTDEQSSRILHELEIIGQMGFAGYFLIVQEFTNEARRRGVYVGPGRGSAAGSVVAYCIGIIDIDPLEYSLLFERFLNPERISPPDIDMDFDDAGREEVINFVVERYGRQCVSQIITYGTMGAKTAIRDVGRTLNIPLPEVNKIAKLIPERPGISFEKALTQRDNPDGYQELQSVFASQDPRIQKLMRYARTLEGTARQTGIHASAVIIAPGAVSDYLPVAISKDKIVTTQYDGPSAEMAGMLKMDFLGLKTLSILKTAVQLVEKGHGVKLDIDHLDLTDANTYQLYQAGDTVATFQFESDGMRKYLRQLKPTCMEDLIAMNALYRPGPMDNIPSFIDRKQGKEKITCQHPLLEPILRNTYGIMVYQEQIMEVARTLAGYTLGGADLLRRAMGKKKADVMAKEREKFLQGAFSTHRIDPKTAGEVFDTMEKFAQYGFNKSHSAAYSVLAFRTAYLKAHYTAEYMVAVLSHWMDSIEKISFFIEECRRMGIPVLPPCVNESELLFSVSRKAGAADKGVIRFGLAAIKGMGEVAAQAIIQERKENGPYSSVFDLAARLPTRTLSRKTLESLAYAGALDTFMGVERWQYFPSTVNDDGSVLDLALQYGSAVQATKASPQASLFGELSGPTVIPEPEIPYVEAWPLITKLNHEREVIGFYLSAHPLGRYKLELDKFATATLSELEATKNRMVRVGGIVTALRERITKNGTPYGVITVEDYSGALEISLFSSDYAKFGGFFKVNNCVLISGKYQPRFGQDEENYELKVTEVKLLETLADELKEMTLSFNLELVNVPFVNALDELLTSYKGKCLVRFVVNTTAEELRLPLVAPGTHVKPCDEVWQGLQKLGVTYQVR